jgi:hypothetical protein
MLKILANNVQKSFIGQKSKHKAQNLKIEDVKPLQKQNNLIHSKSQLNFQDLTVSRLPNFNILMVENVNT